MSAIGIDFGTTNSVVAKFDGGTTEVLPIDTPPDMRWAEWGCGGLVDKYRHLDPGQPGRDTRAVSGKPSRVRGHRDDRSREVHARLVRALAQSTEEKGGDFLDEERLTTEVNAIALGELTLHRLHRGAARTLCVPTEARSR